MTDVVDLPAEKLYFQGFERRSLQQSTDGVGVDGCSSSPFYFLAGGGSPFSIVTFQR